jgi:hypothetical protein
MVLLNGRAAATARDPTRQYASCLPVKAIGGAADQPCVEDLLSSVETRCPSCRAAVRPGAPWCTLCHADLRPAPEPQPEPARPALSVPPTASYAEPALDPLTAPAVALGLPPSVPLGASWPCATCGASNALTESSCTACGAGFLAGLKESEAPLLVVPGVGDVTQLSRAQRLGLAAGVVVAVLVLTALLGLLFS